MDETTRRVYQWIRDNRTRTRLTNQAIRTVLRVDPKYIRRAKAIIRAEDALVAYQPKRSAAIERLAANLREWGITTKGLSDYQIMHLASIH